MSDPTNPLATPASPFATPAAPTAPTSPFAAPATTAAASPAESAPIDMGDTSYLDTVPGREPLIKNCVVPGTVASLDIKESQSGNTIISIAVQLWGDKMVNTEGQPVSAGKRLTTTIFPFSKTEREAVNRVGNGLRDLLLALHDVPLEGDYVKLYAAWPPAQKPGLLRPYASPDGTQRVAWSLHPFNPTSQWAGKKVLVNVRAGKDMDGNPRNEFTLLAASTKPVERKGRS